MTRLAALRLLAVRARLRRCDYCGELRAWGMGRVPAYRALVCEPCYRDHHGECGL